MMITAMLFRPFTPGLHHFHCIELETNVYPLSFQVENTRIAAQMDTFMDSKDKLMVDKTTAERRGLFSVCELHIKESDEQLGLTGKEAGKSFGATDRNMEVFEVCM